MTYTDTLGTNHTYTNISRTFYVREITLSHNTAAYVGDGDNLTMTCDTSGDANTVVWSGSGNSPTISGGVISMTTVDTSANYTCTVTWTDGGRVDEVVVEVVVLEYPVVGGDERKEMGGDAVLTCVADLPDDGLVPTIEW